MDEILMDLFALSLGGGVVALVLMGVARVTSTSDHFVAPSTPGPSPGSDDRAPDGPPGGGIRCAHGCPEYGNCSPDSSR